MKNLFSLLILGLVLTAASCKKDPPDPTETPAENGKLTVTFSHNVNGSALVKDSMMYVNDAANPYEINELKYFISDFTLYKDGSPLLITDPSDKHYVDIDIPSTLTWTVNNAIPAGDYDSVSFVFGFTPAKNISYMFVNPPEAYMAWPEVLGGGYHYMMMNGKWKDLSNLEQNFRFHMGIGRVISGNDTSFVHNNFRVSLPSSAFSIAKDQAREINIVMNIESWFKTPTIYDFNYWGADIMENEAAMSTIKSNGWDVFSVGFIH